MPNNEELIALAERLAQALDCSPQRALAALRNLESKGLITRARASA